ncbi:MoxR family ATPase [Peribacillus sp. Bi134]|uniref:AAA family ATPase n=1 Tax=Peribacillus sp. Bi134 TaxID=2884272 RepID=UPI001DF6E412|nr:MoxR family ATPase [Peribacillus sp. Bi134]CAH0298583.1 5-methylcytosine-specific restriction enzyme B [Peribacillus sp. Bi134]
MVWSVDGGKKKLFKLIAPPKLEITEKDIQKNLSFDIPVHILLQICAAINSGKNIILVGAPGTGKTTVAQAICKAAYFKLFSLGTGMFTTATSDWSTFDTVGGYMPNVNGRGSLEFSEGIITRAINRREWLIIDEINRADIDKALGPFFSVFSQHEVVLPFKTQKGDNLKIKPGTKTSTADTFYMHPLWRLIGTMNDFDKLSLYEISYAFMRRFAIIRIPIPRESELKNIISTLVPNCNLDTGFSKLFKISKHREIGPSVFLDMAKYIINRNQDPAAQTAEHLREAIELFLFPQFEGLSRTIKKEIGNIINDAIPMYPLNDERLEFGLLKLPKMESENDSLKDDIPKIEEASKEIEIVHEEETSYDPDKETN